ncbi:carbohydrate kinase family protein [Methanococcoides burtonii]|uniref:Nucleoside kinase n=1 Tax=Methanococcoides burtonii (strain DSM 6242 / NBRC 107633 / OCM 468 / ACE-M) TaxID=259564 RepID=Q12XB8_METBU|nr:carbohydrate kinase family protein [Methanococcoides burtonii]ABE51908.1 nucleoside kinase [Methanococcoides burtonii DSM 6242]
MSDSISVVGHAAIDFLFDVEGISGPNESNPIVDYQRFYGGGAANIVAAISILGGRSQLISAVGDDFSTSGYESYLESLGVDLSLLFRLKGEKGTAAYVFTDPFHNQSTYFYWGASAKLKELEPPEVDFVHLATSESNFNAKIAKKAKFVSFDPGQDLVTYTRENLEIVLENTDILFTNKYEIKRVCEMTESTFEDIRAQIDVVVVTYDADGSKIFTADAEHEIPIVPVNALDPTGAGDAYRAGFLVSYRRGYPLDSCGRVGATVASFAVGSVGCQTDLPTWDDMVVRYESHFGAFPSLDG